MELNFFPDFFIVGAPRCGTTSLSRYLSKHPQICFSKTKEPHYFTTVSSNCTPSEVQTQYLAAFFPHHNADCKAVGEGSISYLYSPLAIDLILRFNPDAKIIAMVRNPVELIHFYHYRLLFTLDEDVDDFSQAWSLQEARLRGEKIPKSCRDPRLLQYAQVARLGAQVERLFQKVASKNRMMIVFDDFVADTAAVYKQVLAFINVTDDGREIFPQKMVSKSFRFRGLQRLVYRPPQQIVKLVAAFENQKKQAGKKKPIVKRLRKRLTRLNTIRRKPPALDDGMRQVLRKTFADDTKRLERLLGRDFSHWK